MKKTMKLVNPLEGVSNILVEGNTEKGYNIWREIPMVICNTLNLRR